MSLYWFIHTLERYLSAGATEKIFDELISLLKESDAWIEPALSV